MKGKNVLLYVDNAPFRRFLSRRRVAVFVELRLMGEAELGGGLYVVHFDRQGRGWSCTGGGVFGANNANLACGLPIPDAAGFREVGLWRGGW